MKEVTAVFITILIAAPSPARIITVDDDGPADFTTIQAAIEDANDGDTVEIQPGTYTGPGNTNIDFFGKAIAVRSTDPSDPCTVAGTTVDCSYPYNGFMFQTNEDANSVLDGLTITGGGPGINIADSAPTIRNCTMTGNHPAVNCDPNGNPTITDCLFTDNDYTGYGAAIYFGGSSGIVSHCVLRKNSVDDDYGRGGAVAVYNTGSRPSIRSNVKFDACLFADCSAEVGGGLRVVESDVTVTNCRFDRCVASRGAALAAYSGEVILINCELIGNNNVFRHPGYSPLYGGALSSRSCNLTLTNCLFIGNYARPAGVQVGALFVTHSDVSIKNSTFADNYALEGNTLVVEFWGWEYGNPSKIHIENRADSTPKRDK